MTNNQPEREGKIEQAGKRVHLLLYGGERESDARYTEWRSDLESAILEWIDAHKSKSYEEGREAMRKETIEILERLKLEFDVVVCECGEKWSESDAADIVNDFFSRLRQEKV